MRKFFKVHIEKNVTEVFLPKKKIKVFFFWVLFGSKEKKRSASHKNRKATTFPFQKPFFFFL